MSHSTEVLALSEKFGLSRAAFDRLVDDRGIGDTGELLGTWQEILGQIEKEEVRTMVRVEMARKVNTGWSGELVTKYANDAVEGYRARDAQTAAPVAQPTPAPGVAQAHDLADKAGVPRFIVDGMITKHGLELAMDYVETKAREVEELRKKVPSTNGSAPRPANGRPKPTPPRPKRPGKVAPVDAYQEPTSKFTKAPHHILAALLEVAPHPVLRGYLFCLYLNSQNSANRESGRFHVTYDELAAGIGTKTKRHGFAVMRRLMAVGLVKMTGRGGPKRSNDYQLVSPETIDAGALRVALGAPLDDPAE